MEFLDDEWLADSLLNADTQRQAWIVKYKSRHTHFELDDLALTIAEWDEGSPNLDSVVSLLADEKQQAQDDYLSWLEAQYAPDLEICEWLKDHNDVKALVQAKLADQLVPAPKGRQKHDASDVSAVLRAVCWLSSRQNSDVPLCDYRTLSELTGFEPMKCHRLAKTAEKLGLIQIINHGRVHATTMRLLIDVDYAEVRQLASEDLTKAQIELSEQLPWSSRENAELIAAERAEWKAIKAAQEVVETTEEGRVDLKMVSFDELISVLGTETAFELTDTAQKVISQQPAKELVLTCHAGIPTTINGREVLLEEMVTVSSPISRINDPSTKSAEAVVQLAKTSPPHPKSFRHLGDGAYDAYWAACQVWRAQNPGRSLIDKKS